MFLSLCQYTQFFFHLTIQYILWQSYHVNTYSFSFILFFIFIYISISLVAQLCPTLCKPMDYSLPGSSIHGIFQARVLEWTAIFFSRGSYRPRDQARVSHIVGRGFTVWATKKYIHICSVQFSHSVISDSLQPHGLQHARPPCPSSTPGVYSNSCPLSQWCHPTISSSVVPFSSCLQSFPASGSFPLSQFFASGGQSIEISALTSVLPMNIQDWFPLGWTGFL